MAATKSGTDVPTEVWETVNHFFKLYEMARWVMMRRLMLNELPWKALSAANPTLDTQTSEVQQKILEQIAINIWGQVETLMEPLLHAIISVPTTISRESREAFYEQLSSIKVASATPQQHSVNLLDAIDTAFKQAILALQRSPLPASVACAKVLRNEFCRFPQVDRKLFLLQVGSNFESTDLIRVVRFSPLDAQRGLSEGPVQNKVRGVALGAFGGFFKKSWRANDIMVGRFDASCLLIECLLTRERLAALSDRRKITPVTVTADELQRFLPELKDAQSLAGVINAYLADPNNATVDQWNDIIDRIVRAYHNEIFRFEYKRVVRCAIEQEHLWGRYSEATLTSPSPATYNAAKQAWIRGQQRPDETIVKIAAQAIATIDVEPFAPGLQPASPFTQEIPESILQELGALATSRIGKGLIDSINQPGLRQKAAGSRFYKYPFTFLAPTVYSWSKMRRTQPDSVVIFNTLVPAICVIAAIFAVALGYLDLQEWRPALAVFVSALLVFIGWSIAFRD
jgi:hypothetical protein